MTNAVYWFSNDLRLADNPALQRAAHSEQNLSFIYCLDPALLSPNHYNCTGLGKHRHRFIIESLIDLDQQLQGYGQHLNVHYQDPWQVFENLYEQHQVRRIYHSVNAGYNERQLFAQIADAMPDMQFIAVHSHTLFEPADLPFELMQLPETFSKFRKLIEKDQRPVIPTTNAPSQLPTPPHTLHKPFDWLKILREPDSGSDPRFNGGATAGLQHLNDYFAQPHAQAYKQTRNALDDWEHSTKFSAWLAAGCISPRQVVSALSKHEAKYGANDSTYWIFFELLWREYFQWYAHAHGARLFRYRGINDYNPLTSFYGERFQRWCNGNTPYPIVNACMKQLNATGYMSNRGRQLVASCFIHELKLDWRYGAAYFEQQLIDYDVAANWGNWQYLAGVGADPRGSRRFNLEKQTQTYDPEGKFIRAWRGEANGQAIDSVDAADWPISPK